MNRIHTHSGLTATSFSQLFVGSFSTITQIRSKTVHMRRTRSTIFALFALFVMSKTEQRIFTTITFLQRPFTTWPCASRFLPLLAADENIRQEVAELSINQPSQSKGKGFPYSLPSVGPGADPGVQAVSSQVTISHPSGGRLPLLSARPAVTFPAAEHHRPLAGTKLHRCEQLAKNCYAALPRVGFEPTTCWWQVQRSTRCTVSKRWTKIYRVAAI